MYLGVNFTAYLTKLFSFFSCDLGHNLSYFPDLIDWNNNYGGLFLQESYEIGVWRQVSSSTCTVSFKFLKFEFANRWMIFPMQQAFFFQNK